MSASDKNNTAIPAADLEPDFSHGPLGEKETPGLDSRCCIHIHSIRKRLTDPDGASGKAAIDGLVRGGLLKDDKTQYVKEVTYSQEKGSPEETIITLTWE